jgi:hypothetical protein
MKMKKERTKVSVGFAALLVLLLAVGSLLYLGPTPVYAGDHLSVSDDGCTNCHGTNIRKIHDYEDTINLDCTICHSTGAPDWYLNNTCATLLTAHEISVTEIVSGSWVLDPIEGWEFGFECKSCHTGMNTEVPSQGTGNKK